MHIPEIRSTSLLVSFPQSVHIEALLQAIHSLGQGKQSSVLGLGKNPFWQEQVGGLFNLLAPLTQVLQEYKLKVSQV